MQCLLVFYKQKSREEGLARQIPQLGKTSDNVTVGEKSAIDAELKKSCKEKK